MLISYAGDLPETLYRYRTVSEANLERLINFEIIEEAVYLAGLKDLNDPDEGRFLLRLEGDRAEIKRYWREALKSTRPELNTAEAEHEAESFTQRVIQSGPAVPEHIVKLVRYGMEHLVRVASFTTQPLSYSMWANYAKYLDPNVGPIEHGGICIEYKCDDAWRSVNLHPVEYSDVVPEINAVSRDENELTKAVYQKSREWRCEEEWRMMSIIQAKPPFPDNLTDNSKIKLENGVTGVIFGMNSPRSLVDAIREKVTVANPRISFKQVFRDAITFGRQLRDLD